ncbi:hypothetical protein [Micromonospora haikouensis]|uniref:hypothetical protein n=1 Tax=Micromonospora haikouensis TaxID=686309 RepID=UPI00159F136A|nr:hypothetical protein [Micromonospora haikouensis]MDI5939438.1 hypothetical protein [Micromonospora sp. DH15]
MNQTSANAAIRSRYPGGAPQFGLLDVTRWMTGLFDSSVIGDERRRAGTPG